VEPEREFIEPAAITTALDEIFDCALISHGFTDYMRDYDLVVYVVTDPASRIARRHVRYRFTHCVRASVTSAIRRDVWPYSLDDGLIEFETGVELDGFVWGVKWEDLYPGAELVNSAEAEEWAGDVGVPFHEVKIETNVHVISLVFSALRVSEVAPDGDAGQLRGVRPATSAEARSDDPPDWVDGLPTSAADQSCAFCGSLDVRWVHRLCEDHAAFELHGKAHTLPTFWTLCGACEEVYSSEDDDAAVAVMQPPRANAEDDGVEEARVSLAAFRRADLDVRALTD
jgi:hypothetical protein